jgi:trimethylamine--corrinoid protein Co-methyltransferase
MGHEKTVTAMLPSLTGGNIIFGWGMWDQGMTISLGQVLADTDFINMIGRCLEGIVVNDDTLAIDVMRNVGIGGQFLTEEHTFKNVRSCQTFPKFIDRENNANWKAQGSKTMLDKANEEVLNILEKHHPQPLTDDQIAKVAAIVKEIDEKYIV